MAKLVDKDPFVYEQEKTGFLQTLHQFLASKGSPFRRPPVIDAKELDLYLLYLKVTELGGFQKVTDEEQWDDLLTIFKLPRNCSHVGNELRQVYVRYLELYEKVHFLGEDEDDKDRSGTRSSTPVRSMVSSHKGYQVPSGVCADFPPNVSEYDKLQFSLLSGLPNEVDFAINVCTLLSNEGRHVLHLARAPALIDHLLAHTGVFFEGPGSLRALYEGSWKAGTERDFVRFWYDTVNDEEVREIIGPEPFKPEDEKQFKDPKLFCQRKLGLLDVEGQRILQIAIILKNLSFEAVNRSIMAAHRTLYRFLLLCIHNSCSMLRQVGTDTLSNLAPEFVMDSIAYRSTQLMFHTIYKGLEDDDRFIVLRSLEVVEKLLDVANNIEVLEQCLEHRVYHTVVNLLHIHDIQILLGALELLLVMSEKGSRFCTFICKVDRSIDILVCLVTLDAQSLGADAFVGVKIIDPNPEAPHNQPHQMSGVPRAGPPQHAPTPPPQQQQQQQVTPGAKSPGRGGASVSVPPGTATPPTTPMSAKDAEAERFACQWLNCHVESNKELSVARVDLYAEYLAACKQAKGNVLSSTNFHRCIRSSYPHVGMKKVVGSTTQYHLTGIGRRKQPLPFTWQPQEALTNVLSSSGRPASSMMAHLASRHSPSPNAVASPPLPRGAPYPPSPHGRMPYQQRGPPLPPTYPQGQQTPVSGYHPNYPHGSPQVTNVRTGYPPGHHQQGIPQNAAAGSMPGATSGADSLPHYQSPQGPHPQHPSQQQQYRPHMGMTPNRLVFGPTNPGSGVAAPPASVSGGSMILGGHPPHFQNHQPSLTTPHRFPPSMNRLMQSAPLSAPQHIQQGGPHMGPPASVGPPHVSSSQQPVPSSGPQIPPGVPQMSSCVPQMPAGGPQMSAGVPQMSEGMPQISSGVSQMSAVGPLVQLSGQMPPMQGPLSQGQHIQGPHIQLGGGPPSQAAYTTAAACHQDQVQLQHGQAAPSSQTEPPNGLTVYQGSSGNIVLQRAPENRDQTPQDQVTGTPLPPSGALNNAQPPPASSITTSISTAEVAVVKPQLKPAVPPGEVKEEEQTSPSDVVESPLPPQSVCSPLMDPPEPPIPPPSNPMVDALSPTGRSTPCPSEVSLKSQTTDSELVSNATDGDGSIDQGPLANPQPVVTGHDPDLMDGEVRIEKVPNARLKGDGEKVVLEQTSTCDAPATATSESVPTSDVLPTPSVPAPVAPPPSAPITGASVSGVSTTTPESADAPVKAPSSSDGCPLKDAPPSCDAPQSDDAARSNNAAVSEALPPMPKVALPVAKLPVPPLEPHFTASGNKITVAALPSLPMARPATQPGNTKSITLVHTGGATPLVQGTGTTLVHASGGVGQIRNVLVPSQSIVLNVQPVVQTQVQGISFQPRPSTPRQQPVNIQPKPIQPKPASFNQQTSQGGPAQTSSSSSALPHAPTSVSLQPKTTATIIHPGQPMMALQRHPIGVPQQIVLGQGFVVRQPVTPAHSSGGNVVRPQFMANIQPKPQAFQHGQTTVVMATSSAPHQVPINTAPLVGFGGAQGNNDAPLIKRLLQQNSPLSPNRQPAPLQQQPAHPPQMQFVQSSQGALVAVNTAGWSPYQQRQGLVNIAPRPMPGGQHSQNPHGSFPGSPQYQPSTFGGPVQYSLGPQGCGPPQAVDQISLPSDLSSPTSSTSSSSKSKKKKSKHKKSKKSSKTKHHSKASQRSQSPAGSGGNRGCDTESVVSETVSSEANPSEASQDSMDHPILVPQTPDINNPLRTQFSGALTGSGNSITCNGGGGTPKKPASKRPKRPNSKSPKPAGVTPPSSMTPPATPNKIVNGVGEEMMIPVEAMIERIENPHFVDRTNSKRSAGGDNALSSCGPDRPLTESSVDANNLNSGNTADQGLQGGDKKNIIPSHFELDPKNVNTKNMNNSNEMSGEAVVNHFINGDMTDDFLKNQLTAALEDKLEKEIAKSIRRSIEKERKSSIGAAEEVEELKGNNKKRRLSNCDSFVNNIFSKDQKHDGVNPITTNGPIRTMENGDVRSDGEKVGIGGEVLQQGHDIGKNKNSLPAGATAINGHPEGYPHVLSPNASVSSSPIGSPPPSVTDQSRVGGHVVLPGNQEQRGVKRAAEEMSRCDTPSSIGSGPMSPPAPPTSIDAPAPKKGSSKKRRSSSTSSSGRRERKSSGKGKGQQRTQQQQPQTNPMSAFFICEWNSCKKNLSSAKSLHTHAYRDHVMSESYKGVCEWEGCDNIRRQRWSTVTHIQEKHCSEESLLMAAERRTQKSLGTGAPKEPSDPVNPVVYNAHTAYHAIRRSLHPPSLGDLMGEKEGPVTRSIRITSSLILKNIAKYSHEGRRLILRYEDRLASVALSKAESSTTISKCLWFARLDDEGS